MATFTDKRGRRYQNDRFREPKVGETIMTSDNMFYGKLVVAMDGGFTVQWSRVDSPDSNYSRGPYPIKQMERDKVMLEVLKPLIIIC